jgi:hypothetical protein
MNGIAIPIRVDHIPQSHNTDYMARKSIPSLAEYWRKESRLARNIPMLRSEESGDFSGKVLDEVIERKLSE